MGSCWGLWRWSGGRWVIGVPESLECHFASHGRKLPEELVHGVPAFEVVDEVLKRNSRPAEAGGPAHDLRVGDNYRFRHAVFILRRCEATQTGTSWSVLPTEQILGTIQHARLSGKESILKKNNGLTGERN